jgi:predicted HicB family RNase H-like nuclease
MDDETIQVLVGHFVELKDKINFVSAGQEELKTDGLPSATFRQRPPTFSSMEYGTGK